MSQQRHAVPDEQDPPIEGAHRQLEREGVLAPLELGGADERSWLDCDLASLAENRLGERIDPRGIDEAQRDHWRRRAVVERLLPPSARTREQCAWLLRDGRRVGSVALDTMAPVGTRVRLASLYVFPDERRHGVATSALERIRDVFGLHGRGVRLETYWTWQPTLRFYFARRMWVRMWKRDLDLWWQAGVPAPWIEIGPRRASLSVDHAGSRIELVRAERDHDHLISFTGAKRARDPASGVASLTWDAHTTLAVALAMHGWPLLGRGHRWSLGWHGDAEHPEGLADRIVIWEAWARSNGWIVDTPQIPGLTYPTWREIAPRVRFS